MEIFDDGKGQLFQGLFRDTPTPVTHTWRGLVEEMAVRGASGCTTTMDVPSAVITPGVVVLVSDEWSVEFINDDGTCIDRIVGTPGQVMKETFTTEPSHVWLGVVHAVVYRIGAVVESVTLTDAVGKTTVLVPETSQL